MTRDDMQQKLRSIDPHARFIEYSRPGSGVMSITIEGPDYRFSVCTRTEAVKKLVQMFKQRQEKAKDSVSKNSIKLD